MNLLGNVQTSTDHVEGKSDFAEPSGSSDAMKVSLTVRLAVGVYGEVKVDDDGHLKIMKMITKVTL